MSQLFIDGQAATLSQTQFASFHGHSVFTTLRVHQRRLLLWHRHWQRFKDHAQFFNFHVPHEDNVLALIAPNLRDNDQKLRLIATASSYAITIEDYPPPSETIYRGVDITFSSWQPHQQFARFKTGNSLPYFLAQQHALDKGTFEALLTNHDGFVVDGSRTSVLHYDGTTMTALDGGLDGVMRDFVLTRCETHGISSRKAYLRRDDLRHQILLTNSLIGIVPVLPLRCANVSTIVEMFRMENNPIFHEESIQL